MIQQTIQQIIQKLVIWHNGDFIDSQDAVIDISDYGLHYAHSVFEDVRVYGDNIFKESEHVNRLFSSANILNMMVPWPFKLIVDAVRQVFQRNSHIANKCIRILVWKSGITRVGNLQGKTNISIMPIEIPNIKQQDRMHENGIKLMVFEKYRQPHQDTVPVYSNNSCLYTTISLGMKHAKRDGYDDIVMLDYQGYIAYTSTDNIFFLKSGTLYNPNVNRGSKTVIMNVVTTLAKHHKIEVINQQIHPDELPQFDEIFIASTTLGIIPVVLIDQLSYDRGDTTKMLNNELNKIIVSN